MEIVSLADCSTYDYDKVKKAIEKNIVDIGGLEKYINKGDKVLLKVNLVIGKKPEVCATTNPVYVEALANIFIEYGCEVIIGDSPGGPFTESLLKGQYKISGFSDVADKTKATLNYNVKQSEVKNPNGKLLKTMSVIDVLNDVDKVISVSKLKTHGMMTYTGAVKNMFGIIPGVNKAEFHFKMPNYDDFADALIDICICANPTLSFMDGIIGMEGEGPTGGSPRNIGVSIASASPYHLDKVGASIISLGFDEVPIIRQLIKRNMITADMSDIELIGRIEDYLIEDFEIPETKMISFIDGKMPKFLSNFINKRVQPKPVFDYKKCVGCGICKEACPAKVISMVDKKPTVDLTKCIRCYCCQELCPKVAVKVERPFILDLIMKRF